MNKIVICISILLGSFFVTMQVNAEITVERLYTQTDKRVYLAGEIVWLKALTINTYGVPQSFSKVAYIELLGGNTPVQQVKIEMNDALGSGYLQIPEETPTGYYHLVGYTRYMQNEDKTVFFEKQIAVINTFRKATSSHADSTQIILQDSTPSFHSQQSISVSLDKKNYPIRTQGIITLSDIPENTFSLSLSIAGKDLPTDNQQTSITEWKNKLADMPSKSFSTNILPEYEGHIITGKMINTQTSEQENNGQTAAFISFPGNQIRLFEGDIDTQGNITFITKRIAGLTQISTTVLNKNTETRYRVDLNSPFVSHEYPSLPSLSLKHEWYNNLLLRSVGLQSLYAYREEAINRQDSLKNAIFTWQPDQTYLLDNYTRFPTMNEVFVEITSFLRFRQIEEKHIITILTENSAYSTGEALVLLDGVLIRNHEDIYNYNPNSIKQIDIYRNNYVFGGSYFGGIVNFLTKDNDLAGYKMDASTQQLNYETPQVRRHFYTPDYSNPNEKESKLPDFRHTLLWEPSIEIGGQSTVETPFSTSDLTGEYVITIEGITTEGETIFMQKSFTVE